MIRKAAMRPSRRLNAHAAFAAALVLFATVYASQIPALGMPFARAGEPGAAFLPIVLVTILYIAAIRTLVVALRDPDAPGEAPAVTSETVPRIALVGPAILVALSALFILGLPRVGYFAAAGGYTFAVALFFNYEETGRLRRAVPRAALTAVAITGFGWLFFETLFDLSLPGWAL